LVKKEMGSSW